MRASVTRDMPPGGTLAPSIVLEDVRLTLTSAAGPVNILNGVSVTVKAGDPQLIMLWPGMG